MPMSAAEKKAFRARMEAGKAAKSGSTEIILAPSYAPARASKTTYLAPPPPKPKKSLSTKLRSEAAIAAVEDRELMYVVGMGGLLGYAEQDGWLQDVPEVDFLPLGMPGSVALYAWAAGKWFFKDPGFKLWAARLTLAGGAVTGYNFGKGMAAKRQLEQLTQKGAGEDDGDDDEGSDDNAGI